MFSRDELSRLSPEQRRRYFDKYDLDVENARRFLRSRGSSANGSKREVLMRAAAMARREEFLNRTR